mmetsp:Transcript_31034/g.56419  ORF Transcript_31034/g.56419 Transcript_31034/m.56419 type:complete len:119 (+) Transcript_31034:1-357(+)
MKWDHGTYPFSCSGFCVATGDLWLTWLQSADGASQPRSGGLDVSTSASLLDMRLLGLHSRGLEATLRSRARVPLRVRRAAAPQRRPSHQELEAAPHLAQAHDHLGEEKPALMKCRICR